MPNRDAEDAGADPKRPELEAALAGAAVVCTEVVKEKGCDVGATTADALDVEPGMETAFPNKPDAPNIC